MQSFNVILDPLYQLSLVLTDGSSDVWAHKQCIESWKDSEHLISILGSTELVSKPCGDTGFDSVNSFIVPEKATYEMKWISMVGQIKNSYNRQQ